MSWQVVDIGATFGGVWNHLRSLNVLVRDAVARRAGRPPLCRHIQPLDTGMYAMAQPKQPTREGAAIVQGVVDTHAWEERFLLRTGFDVLPLKKQWSCPSTQP